MVKNKNMELQEKVTQELKRRGFTEKKLINNRGLIGATIFETIYQIAGEESNSNPKKIKRIIPKKVIKQVKKTDKLITKLNNTINDLKELGIVITGDLNISSENFANMIESVAEKKTCCCVENTEPYFDNKTDEWKCLCCKLPQHN